MKKYEELSSKPASRHEDLQQDGSRSHSPRLFLMFNHHITPLQRTDAVQSLGVEEIIPLSEDVHALWSNVPADLPQIAEYLEPIRDWLRRNARPGDYVLIQGDFGACYLVVRFSLGFGLVPVYSSTVRQAEEEVQPDGTIKLTHYFGHRRFRMYGV